MRLVTAGSVLLVTTIAAIFLAHVLGVIVGLGLLERTLLQTLTFLICLLLAAARCLGSLGSLGSLARRSLSIGSLNRFQCEEIMLDSHYENIISTLFCQIQGSKSRVTGTEYLLVRKRSLVALVLVAPMVSVTFCQSTDQPVVQAFFGAFVQTAIRS